MNTIYWFLLGVREFRLSITTSPPDEFEEAYGSGREFAHVMTLRRFES